MAQDNPTNPFTRDANHTSKDVQMPIQKARVLSSKGHPEQNGFHTARIRVYGDEAPYLAPVITPMPGSVWVPKAGTDVAVVFTQSGKPWIIGSWYALDRIEDGEVDLPAYNPGDMRVGNHTGSHVTVRDSGTIKIETGGSEPINIDHQSASVRMSTDQTIPDNVVYTTVNFDTVQDDPEGLFNPSAHSFTVRHGGQHRVEATVEVEAAGQNNLYTVGMFANDTLIKRKRRQSTVNAPMSVSVSTTDRFEDDTDIEIRMRQDNGSDKIINSAPVATEFTIERHGI